MNSFALRLNARDEVVLVRGEESINLGPRDEAVREMLRFLEEMGSVEPAASAIEFT